MYCRFARGFDRDRLRDRRCYVRAQRLACVYEHKSGRPVLSRFFLSQFGKKTIGTMVTPTDHRRDDGF